MISITNAIPNATNLQTARSASREAPFFGTVAQPDLRDSYLSVGAAQESSATFQSAMDSFGNYLLKSFADKVLGDDAAGAVFSFEVSSTTGESNRAGVEQLGTDGVQTYSGYTQEKQHFSAKGTITTADGRKFDFDIDVQNELDLQTSDDGSADVPDRSASAYKLPDFGFPGYLVDLLRLIGVEYKGTIAGQDGQQAAALKMRVVHVANHTGDDDTYTVAPVMQQEGPANGPLHFAKGEASSVEMHIGDTAVSQQAGNLLDLTSDVFGDIPPEK